MNFMSRSIIASGLVLAVTPMAAAHVYLSTPLKPRYELRTINCAACHQKDVRDKSIENLTPFGSDIAKILEGKDITKRITEAKKLDRAERDKALDAIKEEYLKALDKLDKMKAPSGKLYSEALPAGEIEGTKPR